MRDIFQWRCLWALFGGTPHDCLTQRDSLHLCVTFFSGCLPVKSFIYVCGSLQWHSLWMLGSPCQYSSMCSSSSGIHCGCLTRRDSLHLCATFFSGSLCGCSAHRDSIHLYAALFSGIPCGGVAHHDSIHLCVAVFSGIPCGCFLHRQSLRLYVN